MIGLRIQVNATHAEAYLVWPPTWEVMTELTQPERWGFGMWIVRR